jgi:hypothetical protein
MAFHRSAWLDGSPYLVYRRLDVKESFEPFGFPQVDFFPLLIRLDELS